MRFTALIISGSIVGMLLGACGTSERESPALTTSPEAGVKPGNGNGNGNGNEINSSSPDAGVQGGDKLPDQCAADTQTAQQVPVDLYLMVDSSGSMDQETAAKTPKWDEVKSALTSFIDDPASAGLGVALQFFPIVASGVPVTCANDAECGATGGANSCRKKACSSAVPTLKLCGSDAECGGTSGDCVDLGECSGFFGGDPCLENGHCGFFSSCKKPVAVGTCGNRDSCTAADYAVPKAAFAQLPGHAAALKGHLNGHATDGYTPTGPALQGAIDAANAQKVANPTHNVAVVLVTDGFPSECAISDIPGIANIAQTGNTVGTKTYVIGVFTQAEEAEAKSNLSQIASKGGTGAAFVVNTTQSVSQAFLQALNSIRGAALPCDYTLPVPKTGSPDYSKVNVQYTSGTTQTTIFKVASASACDPSTGGWYYDIEPTQGTPTKVMMCAKTCEGFKGDTQSKVDIVQGCTTIVK